MTQKPLAITMGEPSGIGAEILVKAWQARDAKNLPPFFALHDPDFLKQAFPDISVTMIEKPDEALTVFENSLPVYPIRLPEMVELGSLNPANAKGVIESIETAVQFFQSNEASGMVTLPLHKAALYEAGFQHPGHTEFIAHLCGQGDQALMMLTAQDLKVVPLTIHIPIKDVPKAITQDLIQQKARILNKALQEDYKITQPRIAICGLNPHAGEEGTIGNEEQEIIAPAIKALQKEGLQVSGPHPADTLFHAEARKTYDAVIGMYHDQVLIPVKALDFYGGVNVTLGLNVVRTSPDHGTALNIAGHGVARADSLIAAIQSASAIAKNRV